MIIDLHRTFSEYRNPVTDNDEQDWQPFFNPNHGRTTWPDLHDKPLVVVLGEAGIGKTKEFQNEVRRLCAVKKFAFFIPLNQLSDTESWQLALTEYDHFDSWSKSNDIGYFFLDAVDEARLRSHADFEKALSIVQQTLDSNLARTRIAVSSRVTDWSSREVQSVVDNRLAKPIARRRAAIAASDASRPVLGKNMPTSHSPDATPSVEAFVVGLDPLSDHEARRYTQFLGLEDKESFWTAVADGNYGFMAKTPLDLEWMTVLWNKNKSLGTYNELIEANICNRLREFNPIYETAGEALSVSQLRAGAIELAAATEFGGCAFLTLNLNVVLKIGELDPQTVLTDWTPTHIRRLLATALFDEASFGRVKFHHRSIREFLAAMWVDKQIALTVPMHRLQDLFSSSPFGKRVMIPTRRATLSWLAAINVQVREWVVRDFPEIFLFEGDPQAWDGISADQAFANFIKFAKLGRSVDWFKSTSEFMRVGRSLGGGIIASALTDNDLPVIKSMCFQIARYSKLHDCAAISFATYRNATALEWERQLALGALEYIGTTEQRQEILADLKTGYLNTNELVAQALPVITWRQLSESELIRIFAATSSENNYGSGPMARMFKNELLPMTDLPTAIKLLGVVMALLPRPTPGQRFVRLVEDNLPEKAWLLDVLPDCFERVLSLLPQGDCPSICIEAAERIEIHRDSGFIDRDQLERLYQAIADHSVLRWNLAHAIARSEDISNSNAYLIWKGRGLVTLGASDLPELTSRANDLNLQVNDRNIWFDLAITIAFSIKHPARRTTALRALILALHDSNRADIVFSIYQERRRSASQMRKWDAKECERKKQDANTDEVFISSLLKVLPSIFDGTDEYAIQQILQYYYARDSRRDDSEVDFELIAKNLGSQIASAFEQGLMVYWRTISPPPPSDYSNGTIPWNTLMAIAGLTRFLRDSNSTSAMSEGDVTQAAQLAVWALHRPPPWFESLARVYPIVVEAALSPWIIAEAKAIYGDSNVRGALEMVLGCAPDIRRTLLTQLVPLVDQGQISRPETLVKIIKTLREDGTLPTATVSGVCKDNLIASIGINGHIGNMSWFSIWMESDGSAAWSWFRQHLENLSDEVEVEINTFAQVTCDLSWVPTPLNREVADVLLTIHACISAHFPLIVESAKDSKSKFFGRPEMRLRNGIPNVFLGARGQVGHDSLVTLLDTLNDPDEISWFKGLVIEHAALDAAQNANWPIGKLKAIGSPFLSMPSTEAQLFDQVVARLEEIRKNLENGPFSERDLFWPRIPEKFLQRWLAAKFRETQNRRFSVHREEEVDNDKKTDIQLSCSTGNVCVEIKPVDYSRGYSANSLTDTLRTQIVNQYLRGNNSSRGILVLMQLDDKTWDIPGGPPKQPFSALVSYLETQAESIKRNSNGVNELTVFGICCVKPRK